MPDPILTEVLRNAFNATADDMYMALVRSAFTPIIYEARDCSAALLDEQHRILGQSTGPPMFLGNLDVCTRFTEEKYGAEVWQPGDVWVVNDSYITGTHLNDMTVFSPIFVDDDLVGFSLSRAHWLDVGSKDPCGPMDSTEIFQEGLRVPPVRLIEQGRERPDVADLLSLNSRLPRSAAGDLAAQVACVMTGQRRIEELAARYGLTAIREARDTIFAQTERAERELIRSIPDGTYRAEGCLDNDGLDDEPYWLRLAVTVSGDQIEVDLRASDDARRGPVNCGLAQAVSACRVAYKLLVFPDTPPNGGSFKPLTVHVRPGSTLAAEPPSACQWYFSQLGLLLDLVVLAMSEVLPESAAAASYGDSMLVVLSGPGDAAGDPWLYLKATPGGWGAWDGSDGESALVNNGNAGRDLPIEVFESKYPVRITEYGLRRGSGGSGRWRGGDGMVREYTVDAETAQLSLWFERSRTPAWGLRGAGAGAPPEVVINPGAAGERRLLKCTGARLRAGDVVRTMTGGGGGFGAASDGGDGSD